MVVKAESIAEIDHQIEKSKEHAARFAQTLAKAEERHARRYAVRLVQVNA